MADTTENSRKKTDNTPGFVLLIGIFAFLLIPQLVFGGTIGTAIITGNVIHAPLAMFGVNITGGTAPLAVQFTDMSMGMPVLWNWDFGDNTGSADQNPIHVFSTAGTYLVSLNITNVTGSSSAVSGILIVNAPAPVVTSVQNPAPAPVTVSGSGNGGDDFPGTGSNGPQSPGHGAGIQGPGQLAPPEAASVIPVSGTGSLTNNPLSADLVDMPGVTVSWTVQITSNPAPDARITTVILQNADQMTQDRFSTALHLVGKEIGSLAYVMIIQKSGITATGPAIITMNVPQDWVDRNGGNGAVTIVRVADDGTTEVLTTTFDGYNSITGYPRFRAESPHGLSTFGLIGMKSFNPQQSPGYNQSAPVQTPAQPAGTPSQPQNPAGMLGMVAAGGIVAMLAIISIALGMYTRKTR